MAISIACVFTSIHFVFFSQDCVDYLRYKGKKVKDVKPVIKDEMVRRGEAVIYSEPADKVMSRSGDDCVVALTDQWYLTYGEKEWREQATSYVILHNKYHHYWLINVLIQAR